MTTSYMWCLFLVLATFALAHKTKVDLTEEDRKRFGEVFEGMFNVDQSSENPSIVSSTAPILLTSEHVQSCLCVPYYLCRPDDNTIYAHGEMDGAYKLDVRFGEDSCPESVEVCCKRPLDAPKKPVTTPPPVERCGVRNEKGIDFNITGGTGKEALFGEFPWTIALFKINGSYFCSGTLIHPSVVVTAAHCLTRIQVDQIKVRAGEWDMRTIKERLPHQERLVRDIVKHPGFKNDIIYDDIALMRLQEPMELALHINVACLPSQDNSFDDAKACYATGWGKDKLGKAKTYAVIMKKINMDVVPNPHCESMLRMTKLGHRFELDDTFLCAGGEKDIDTCQGDGGAPLVCKTGEQYRQAGIVAWGVKCGVENTPGVYTRVTKYREWIDDIVKTWGFDPAVYTASD